MKHVPFRLKRVNVVSSMEYKERVDDDSYLAWRVDLSLRSVPGTGYVFRGRTFQRDRVLFDRRDSSVGNNRLPAFQHRGHANLLPLDGYLFQH